MSLQRYLVLLIVVLIVAFSSFQLYFIEQVKDQVNDEIVKKSRTISQVALSAIAKHNDYVPAPTRPTVKVIKISPTPNREIILSEGLVLITGAHTKTLKVSARFAMENLATQYSSASLLDDPKIDALALAKPTIVSKIDALVLNEMNGAYRLDFAFNDSAENFQKFVSFDTSESSIDKYFERLKWQLLSFTVLGLLVAFWLANQVSKPLGELTKGFVKLKQGKLGVQLPKTGIKEMQDTIGAFNTTSKRLQELQLLEKSYRQQQQMAELGEVARGLAHTLRNPLNTIGLSVSRLLDDDLTNIQKEDLVSKIQYKISHLDDTIKSLMHLANTDINRNVQIDVSAIVADVILEMTITSVVPIVYTPPNNPVLLRCSEAEVRAMFHALISNAIEASAGNKSRGNENKITVDLHAEKSGVTLKIIDEGEGINQQDIAHLFTPHYTTKADGAGMGLFIVKRISELYYHGKVQLKNASNGGCCASLVLFDATDYKKQPTHFN